MTLKEFRDYIDQLNDGTVFTHGISLPFSWRGNYGEVAFKVLDTISQKEDMLKAIAQAYTKTFHRYNVGKFTFKDDTPIHFENDNSSYTDGGYVERWIEHFTEGEEITKEKQLANLMFPLQSSTKFKIPREGEMSDQTTKERLARLITGSEYPFSLTGAGYSKGILTGTDLVIVSGGSDNIMSFCGAIDDEVGCCGGGKAYLDKDGLLENKCYEGDDCPHYKELTKSAQSIEALWCVEEDFSWTYKTDIPHATFAVMEDGEYYCRGIVFNLADASVAR